MRPVVIRIVGPGELSGDDGTMQPHSHHDQSLGPGDGALDMFDLYVSLQETMSDDAVSAPAPRRRDVLLQKGMSEEDYAAFKSLVTVSLKQNRELSPDDRKAAAMVTIDTVFGAKYPWLADALSFVFDLLFEVQDGQFSVKTKAKSWFCC